ncbi:MAG: M60 family metallopeptidase, partial [Bacteroidaceae bacterium]|nr:M60 family metallopeptidase [Bacteroidaceae bacterium]
MKNNYFVTMLRSLLAILVCIFSTNLLAVTEVHVEKAGTLSSLLTTTDTELKVTGVINGTDIKFIRELVTAGTVTRLDWSGVKIVAGGEAYFESFKTEDNVIGEKMFTECSNLQSIVLPSTLSSILSNAFSRTGLKQVDIPNSVTRIGSDAFAYCNSLQKVIVGKRVTHLGQGVFFSSAVRYAYVKPITPPAPPVYLFSSNPSITVYSTALADYRDSGWKDYGTIRGGLENTYPMEPDPYDAMKALCGNYFEDAACTQLKAEYQAMSDEQLTTTLTEAGMSELLIATAIKIKNQDWAAYEQDFRIHNYKAYSDANYWNEKMMSSGGSYMGNPTGIYAQNDGDEIYVFVDCDVPADATLYFAGCVENDLITSAKSGQKLTKGLNVIDGTKDAIYYVLYTADTKSQTKTLSEWPEIKIHVAGGKVNGYYDVSRHSDADYQAILKAATLPRFTVRGGHSLYHLKTSSYKSVFPRSIDKSIIWFDSVAVWQKELMGMCESVASGKKAGAPWFLTGGEAIYPLYYNNPNFAIEGEETDAGYANASTYRTAYNSLTCIRNCLDATNPEMDDWCAGHECGHNNQRAINLEGCGESSNNLFSNYVRYLDGLVTSNGSPLSTVMGEFARHEPFYTRNVDSKLRMYWNLYLYYHLGQKNTSFYPELFKALRKDPMTLWNASNNNNSGLKFVRKVCEIAQEDLTDFFTVWGFFEPMNRQTIEDYGTYTMTVTKSNINSTKYNISKYPVKNREIIFVEDRADYVLTNGFLTTAGKKRRGSEVVGQCGDLGQFTDYWPGACAPSEYVYMYADSLYAMEGKGGLGFLMLDA